MTLRKEGYRPRIIDPKIERGLGSVGAVCVEGPKFSGKTWASFSHCESAFLVGDPAGNFRNRALADVDVSEALAGESPHLVDEWQDCPAIWDAVRFDVDSRGGAGYYVLTGSSTPVTKGVMHSGAGRINRIRMRTMSLYESGDSDGRVPLASLFDGTFENSYSDRKVEVRNLISLTARGGWPKLIGATEEAAAEALESYVETILDDVAKLGGSRVSKRNALRVLKSLARNESTLATAKKLVSDTSEESVESMDAKTLERYLGLLDRLFLIEDQPAFDPKYRSPKRVGVAVKRHLTDPSLAISLLDMGVDDLYGDLETYGFMFEAMCERDLAIYASANHGKLYHYRDGDGREIDAVVELKGGRWGAFEIKLGTNQIDEAARKLTSLRDYMESNGAKRPPEFLAVIVGTGADAYRRNDDVCVVPITALKDRRPGVKDISDVPRLRWRGL